MKKFLNYGLSAAFVFVTLFTLQAPVSAAMFQDCFNTENGGNYQLNYDGFAKWTVSNGTVDLIGVNSPWDFFQGKHGQYVDLDGSTSRAGTLTSNTSFAPGRYTLQFDLAGNQRGYGSDTVEVKLGSWSTTFNNLPSTSPYTLYTFAVTTTTLGPLSFHNQGGDNVGAILDNVKVSTVPLPASLLFFGPGLGGIALARKRFYK